jgi:SNF2 family DNA or RNA helicase
MVNGTIKTLDNYETEDNSITFIQYQAGSMGLNLQKANKIIYFTPPLSSEFYEQSRKRVHRLGQTKTCFYYQMICQGSIEERIYKTLAMRKDYTDELFKKEEDYE